MDKTATAPRTLQDAIRYFSDPDVCLAFMVEQRWPDRRVTCPICGSDRVTFLAAYRRWKCAGKHPRRQFSIKVGTIFEDSPLGLDKWLPALWMLVNDKNGISSYEIHRALGITQKTAWFMLHRLRLAMKSGNVIQFSGRVEADETFIGPNPKNMHASKLKARRLGRTDEERYVSKAVVAGLLDRAKGRVHAQVVPNVQATTLAPMIRQNVEPGSEMITDMLRSYWQIRDDYIHSVIDKTKMYVKGHVHTNGLENFWSLLKRALRGTYIAVDAFHLHRYVDEQAFRFNERRDSRGDVGRFVTALRAIVGKRLTYRDLTTDPGLATTPA
ncbi:MAG: IS1595 family transposase [Candidatus Rokubacteria bacterium]|nr:IS1595 family transposase [Candidatus Rokubacteria bacterium]